MNGVKHIYFYSAELLLRLDFNNWGRILTICAMPVSALQSFNLKFSGDDHHVGRYAVSKNGSFMEDGSGNQADCSYSISPITLIPRAAIDKMKSENVHFINRFGMGMYKGA